MFFLKYCGKDKVLLHIVSFFKRLCNSDFFLNEERHFLSFVEIRENVGNLHFYVQILTMYIYMYIQKYLNMFLQKKPNNYINQIVNDQTLLLQKLQIHV